MSCPAGLGARTSAHNGGGPDWSCPAGLGARTPRAQGEWPRIEPTRPADIATRSRTLETTRHTVPNRDVAGVGAYGGAARVSKRAAHS